ncbi:rab proteins geranylgeranyltransferase component A 1-like [Physella acuta]|uniref:rab proteins geranylgeranyltransferase component A 1-like n=1 Tax=Physella acuta TaxID=109671 RepID=UPI0027DBBAB8|nr:rab proteins geranylgeranyltransferase component A 1-like [Physella acuta]XP_059163147.1 rab proteins geranylgeranyltransferase component A 1-like [Physella acuta]
MAAIADLPDEFDVVVLGTGLTETIVAAACSRLGLKILHLDRNDFYGNTFGNFSLQGLEAWQKKNQNLPLEDASTSVTADNIQSLLRDEESLLTLPQETASAFNIKSQYYIRERTEEEEKEAQSKKVYLPYSMVPVLGAGDNDLSANSSTEPDPKLESTATCEQVTEDLSQLHIGGKESGEISKDVLEDKEGSLTVGRDENNKGTQASEEKEKDESKGEGNDKGENISKSLTTEEGCEGDRVGQTTEAGQKIEEQTTPSAPKEWTVGELKDNGRKFCFDLSPKLLYCSGELVELLIQSDVARYCEFRTVSRVLNFLQDKLQQVPCSRADVFSSKVVSLIEKRLMMKFLQFVAEYEKSPQEYQDFVGKPFVQFMKSKKLTENIQKFIQHSIAMVTDEASTEQGLKKAHKFLHSLGRYGNTAFLFPLYGTGELPQAFSRLSAVFGGVYCLTTSASHLILDSENKCSGIITTAGQRIACKYLIAETSYLPTSYVKPLNNRQISRAIFVTDSSILPSPEPELSLLHYVSKDDPRRPVTVVELPPSACVCPRDLFVVHLTRISDQADSESDFMEVTEHLFATDNNTVDEKPKILWSMHFAQKDYSEVELTGSSPKNILVTSGGGGPGVDLEYCVLEAKKIFQTVCPDEEFLPKPPNPEDIILVDDKETIVDVGPSEFEAQSEDKKDTKEEEGSEQKEERDEHESKEVVQ